MNLDELERLHQAATPGPWVWAHTPRGKMDCLMGAASLLVMDFARRGLQGAQPVFRHPRHNLMTTAAEWDWERDGVPADAALIAAARNALPVLLRVARAAQIYIAHRKEWDASLDEVRNDDDEDRARLLSDLMDDAESKLRAALADLEGPQP